MANVSVAAAEVPDLAAGLTNPTEMLYSAVGAPCTPKKVKNALTQTLDLIHKERL
jgi:hypothetical protein